MSIEQGPNNEEVQNEAKTEGKIEVGDIIEGKILQGKSLVGIGMVDNEKFSKYLTEQNIPYEIYSYVGNPEDGLLVLDEDGLQKKIFDAFAKKKVELDGGFWSNSTVSAKTKLTKVV
jgi:hypothetical protein